MVSRESAGINGNCERRSSLDREESFASRRCTAFAREEAVAAAEWRTEE